MFLRRLSRLLEQQPARLGERRRLSDLVFSHELKEALNNNLPIVALESTIITHGMPYPKNLETAIEVEDVVRGQGAVPATIAIHGGKAHVGLSRELLEKIASTDGPRMKISRRDLAPALAQKVIGGTTVAGTMVIAERAGIDIFVTGGIGGVHRGAETTMDISADLIELGRTPVTVVSAGIKSILDIEKTLEFLETQGVCVVTYGESREFPCFFTKKSGFSAPWNVTTPGEAADLITAQKRLHLKSGILIGNPIPDAFEADGEIIERSVVEALGEAQRRGIKGKAVTPFILGQVHQNTQGASLKSNVALVKNNALIGSRIARTLAERSSADGFIPAMPRIIGRKNQETIDPQRPVVIGGSIVDFNIKLKTERNFVKEIETYDGVIQQSYGGVARNIADCLTRLGLRPLLLSAVGNDFNGTRLLNDCSHMERKGIAILDDANTSTCCAVHNCDGSLFHNIADMDIHGRITASHILRFESDIRSAPMVIIDGNIPEECCSTILDLCSRLDKPVWFEPTSNNCSTKPFDSERLNCVWFTSPNSDELEIMYSQLIGETIRDNDTITRTATMARRLVEAGFVRSTVFATMGEYGLIRAVKKTGTVEVTHFETPQRVESIKTANGAGDCQASALISGIALQLPEAEYLAAAMNLPLLALKSFSAVPENITPTDLTRWRGVRSKLVTI